MHISNRLMFIIGVVMKSHVPTWKVGCVSADKFLFMAPVVNAIRLKTVLIPPIGL